MYENFVKLNKTHIKSIANMLAESFIDNPLFIYLFPDFGARQIVMPIIHQSVVEIVLSLGDVYATSERIEGVFAVRRIGRSKLNPSFYKAILMAMTKTIKLARYISIIDVLKRAWKLKNSVSEIDYFSKNHSNYIALDMVAVDKKYRGQKYMSKMLHQVLQEVKETKTFCVLETETESNVQIYQHFGFKLYNRVKTIDKKLTFYIMLYDPYDCTVNRYVEEK